MLSWIVLITFIAGAITWALLPRKGEQKKGDYDFAFWVPQAFRLAFAIIVSLLAVIIWMLAVAL